MACNCGGVKVPVKKATPARPQKTQVRATRVTPAKVSGSEKPKKQSVASRTASRIATKRALAKPNPYANGCKC